MITFGVYGSAVAQVSFGDLPTFYANFQRQRGRVQLILQKLGSAVRRHAPYYGTKYYVLNKLTVLFELPARRRGKRWRGEYSTRSRKQQAVPVPFAVQKLLSTRACGQGRERS